MSDESKLSGIKNPAIEALTAQDPRKAEKPKAGNRGEIGQQEFLTLLVNQLQQQDPMDPMKSEDFAVQLAQFSQLEQLIGIRNAVSASGTNAVSSMASFLGHEVVLKEPGAQISGGSGPNLLVNIPNGAQSARVDFMDENGAVKGSMELTGPLSPGRQKIALENLSVPDGTYTTRAVAVSQEGSFVELDHKVSGTVEGFVMEPEAMLLVNGQEVSLESIAEVVGEETFEGTLG